MLLDLGLPDQDGLDVLRQLLQVSTVPVIILTARNDERSIVRGLRIGADDYLVKPARLPKLVARIDVVRRRAVAASGAAAPERIVSGDVEVDLENPHMANVAGRSTSPARNSRSSRCCCRTPARPSAANS